MQVKQQMIPIPAYRWAYKPIPQTVNPVTRYLVGMWSLGVSGDIGLLEVKGLDGTDGTDGTGGSAWNTTSGFLQLDGRSYVVVPAITHATGRHIVKPPRPVYFLI